MIVKTISAVTVATALALTSAAPAMAKGREERAAGSCGSTAWKLKAKADDGRLEVEFEVDSNRRGQLWRVRIRDNGHRVFKGHRVTHGPSGSFSVERSIANRAGRDHLVGRARLVGTPKVCRGTLTF